MFYKMSLLFPLCCHYHNNYGYYDFNYPYYSYNSIAICKCKAYCSNCSEKRNHQLQIIYYFHKHILFRKNRTRDLLSIIHFHRLRKSLYSINNTLQYHNIRHGHNNTKTYFQNSISYWFFCMLYHFYYIYKYHHQYHYF